MSINGRRQLGRFGNDLEQWLSYLASEQPWLSEQENLGNRARFISLTRDVHDAVAEAELEAVAGRFESWLQRFVWWLFEREADIATFNYDLLLERAASAMGLVDTWADIYQISLADRRRYFLDYSYPDSPVARLYKLHGSINWSYPGTSAPVSERITITQNSLGWRPDDPRQSEQRYRDEFLYKDLVPMIVPPTFSKGLYYGNTSLRAQWRDAAIALSNADHLIVVGYSLPPSDLNARQFLATSFKGPRVSVIDPKRDIAQRYEELFASLGPQLEWINSVDSFTDDNCGDIISWGTYRHDSSYEYPYIRKNGVDATPVVTTELPWTLDGNHADFVHARDWASEAVEHRWPGIGEKRKIDHRTPQDDTQDAHFAYVPKGGWPPQ